MRLSKQTIALIIGLLFVSAWTVFRFFSQSINFDLTGQQLLARQWLEGYMDGSLTAPTHYILKMVLFYMPSELLHVSPVPALIGMSLLINAATFVGIFFLVKKLLTYFAVPITSYFYLAMVWFASIAGSVFWIQFTNSRNLEVVLGLATLYLGLLLFKRFTSKRFILFIAVGLVTFFCDPMQHYIIPSILVLYAAIMSIRKRAWRPIITLLIAILSAAIGATILTWIVQSLTHVEFFGVSSLKQSLAVLSQPVVTITETVKNSVRLLGGGGEWGVVRQLFNVLFVTILAGLFIATVVRKKLPRPFALFIAVGVLVTIGIYIASGQPVFQTDTSRYLIMLVPILILAFAALKPLSRLLIASFVFVISVNGLTLGVATFNTLKPVPNNYTALEQRFAYLAENSYAYGYASMDTAIPATYLFGRDAQTLLPLSCDKPDKLRKANLFFDTAVFKHYESSNQAFVPVILDKNVIKNYPSSCSVQIIKNTYGEPQFTDSTKNGDVVLVYSAPLTAR